MHFCRDLHLARFTHFFRKFFLAKIAFSVTLHVFFMYDQARPSYIEVNRTNYPSPSLNKGRQAYKRHHLHPFVLVSSWLLKGSWEVLTDHGVVLSVNVNVAYFVEVTQ